MTHFTTEAIQAFRRMEGAVDAAVLDTLGQLSASGGRINLETLGIRGPSSTWTYLVNDDPFRNQIGQMLTGPKDTQTPVRAFLHEPPRPGPSCGSHPVGWASGRLNSTAWISWILPDFTAKNSATRRSFAVAVL